MESKNEKDMSLKEYLIRYSLPVFLGFVAFKALLHLVLGI